MHLDAAVQLLRLFEQKVWKFFDLVIDDVLHAILAEPKLPQGPQRESERPRWLHKSQLNRLFYPLEFV